MRAAPNRDGTRGIYVEDPSGNILELIHYPDGDTHYDQVHNRGKPTRTF